MMMWSKLKLCHEVGNIPLHEQTLNMEKIVEILNSLKQGVDFWEEKEIITQGILDSVDLVELITKLEEQYEVEIPFEEISPENFDSAESICNLLGRIK